MGGSATEIQAGELRHRVQVQTRTQTADAHGGPVDAWTTQATRWASVHPLSGRELLLASQVDSRISVRVTMREYPGLSAGQRILFGSRALGILAVQQVEERGRKTICDCEEDV